MTLLVPLQAACRKSNLLHFLLKSSQQALSLCLTVSVGKHTFQILGVSIILFLCVKSGQHLLSWSHFLVAIIRECNKCRKPEMLQRSAFHYIFQACFLGLFLTQFLGGYSILLLNVNQFKLFIIIFSKNVSSQKHHIVVYWLQAKETNPISSKMAMNAYRTSENLDGKIYLTGLGNRQIQGTTQTQRGRKKIQGTWIVWQRVLDIVHGEHAYVHYSLFLQ